VVHGTWSKAHPTPAGSSSTYYDSYEVLTDNNGEFKIPGQGFLVLSQVEEMDVTILKAGYEEFEDLWVGLKDWGPDGKVTWQGNKVTIK